MNTLSKQITRRFFKTEDGYARLIRRMSALIEEDKRRSTLVRKARKQDSGIAAEEVPQPILTAAHHLFYLILRGKDWRKAFKPVTKQVLLDNGWTRWRTATAAVLRLHSSCYEADLLAPFADLLSEKTTGKDHEGETEQILSALEWARRLVPKGDRYDWVADLDRMDAYLDMAEKATVAA